MGDISEYSEYPHECETLLIPTCRFKVVDCRYTSTPDIDQVYLIILKERRLKMHAGDQGCSFAGSYASSCARSRVVSRGRSRRASRAQSRTTSRASSPSSASGISIRSGASEQSVVPSPKDMYPC